MEEQTKQIPGGMVPPSPVRIEDELKDSFLDYAMSVVVSRAIPDVRDGLKPVHRRVLYTMGQLGFHYNKRHRKSVRVVGEVLGKYHPHGDQALYNAMVGMVQDFSKRYPLLDGQGNWGSVDGDNAAAMRYTEVRMAKISQELLADLEKETVTFVPNFDESTTEPILLPSKLPHLLINGTTGIAVGMATSIPPHNLREVADGCLALLEDPTLDDDQILKIIPGPDFPTGGIICGRAGVLKAYKTGRGSVKVRGVVTVEEGKKGDSIIITELPYLVNKSDLAVKIATLVKDRVIEGISNIKDESNRRGMRLVVDVKRGEDPYIIINQLYKYTTLQTNITIIMLALLDNRPIVFTLKGVLREFLKHRRNMVYKRTQYELKRARAREHLFAGFIIALDSIDAVIKVIKTSSAPVDAIASLNKSFGLTQIQAKAILEMRLQRLTGMEQDKIRAEMGEIKERITYLSTIVDDDSVLTSVVREELEYVRNTYGDDRKTRIEAAADILTEIDLIPDEDVVVTLTGKGYIKRVQLDNYGVQHRGGKGKMGMVSLSQSDDLVQDLCVARNHDELLFFTNFGRVYTLPVFAVPESSRTAKGRAIVNILPLNEGERVVKLLCTRELEGKFVVMLTKLGVIKRTAAQAFAKVRKTGIRASKLREGDELIFCSISSGEDSIVIATRNGKGIRFPETEVRSMGRQAAGVMGIRLRGDDHVVGMEVVSDDRDILFATERGYGKRVRVKDFRVAHRGGLGVRTIPTTARNGHVIALAVVDDTANILMIDTVGKIIRLSPSEIRTMGRQAKGVRLIRLDEKQRLATVVSFYEDETRDVDSNDSEDESVAVKQEDQAAKPVDSTDLPKDSKDANQVSESADDSAKESDKTQD